MLYTLAKTVLRMLDPVRDVMWHVIAEHAEKDPEAVAKFANERLARGGMTVRVVPGPLPEHRTNPNDTPEYLN